MNDRLSHVYSLGGIAIGESVVTLQVIYDASKIFVLVRSNKICILNFLVCSPFHSFHVIILCGLISIGMASLERNAAASPVVSELLFCLMTNSIQATLPISLYEYPWKLLEILVKPIIGASSGGNYLLKSLLFQTDA